MYSKDNALHMMGMGGTVMLFPLGVAKGVQVRHKVWTKTFASSDLDKVCSATEIKEGCTDGRERS